MKRFISVLIIFLVLGYSANAQTHPMRVGGQISLDIPLGSYSDGYSTGFGINGLFIYNLQPQLDLTGSLGYIHLGGKTIEGFGDYKWSSVPLLVGARYSFPGSSTFTPYVGGELGLFFSSLTTAYTGPVIPGYTFATSATASETEFALVPQAGFTYPITPTLLLDVNAKFNLILSGATGTIFGIHAGVTYGI